MDKERAYTEIYSLLYSKDNEHLTHERRMKEIRSVLIQLSDQRFKDGMINSLKEHINILHELIMKKDTE